MSKLDESVKLKKALVFTDIHFGRKNNSETHNQDCINFIKWFCELAKKKKVDHIMFLGDWHEHRAAINGLTLKYSHMGAELLNQLGIPVIMCVGNHDMYYRDKRDVYTTEIFAPFENITLVYDSPKIFPMLGDKGALVSPYLMPEEYPELLQYTNMPIWWGHFEFSGFVITGDTRVLEHGPDHKPYKAVKHIFSGHFHKRQCKDNVCYIGNAFPADFSDANDAERGAFLYSYDDDASSFYNWGADFGMPTYVKANLSEIIEDPDTHLKKNARVRCLADIDLTLEDSNELRDTLMKKYGLRELTFEEMSTDEALTDTDMDLEGMELETTTNIVVELLGRIKEPKIDNQKLIKVYKDLGDV